MNEKTLTTIPDEEPESKNGPVFIESSEDAEISKEITEESEKPITIKLLFKSMINVI
jgi:hypothetical protein